MLRLPPSLGFMRKKRPLLAGAGAAGLLWVLVFSLGGGPVLTVAVHPASREVFHELLPRFRRQWLETTGKRIEVRASYRVSGSQSRAVAGGFPADVAVFSLDSDVARLEKAGLITHDWRAAPHRGVVATSIVVLAVRDGNPKGIRGWGDFTRPGVEVLTSHPKVSGAPWNFLALYGSADRGGAPPYGGGDAGAFRFCKAVLKNVRVLDADARASFLRFERGLGDVAVTYENEVLAARRWGQEGDRIIPRSTLLVQTPAALVDVCADRHGVRAEAEAFLNFLWTPEAQEVFARHGFRPVDKDVLAEYRWMFPAVADLWTVEDYGGWGEVGSVFFGPGGLFDSVMEETRAEAS